jgi:hypothetical protein
VSKKTLKFANPLIVGLGITACGGGCITTCGGGCGGAGGGGVQATHRKTIPGRKTYFRESEISDDQLPFMLINGIQLSFLVSSDRYRPPEHFTKSQCNNTKSGVREFTPIATHPS